MIKKTSLYIDENLLLEVKLLVLKSNCKYLNTNDYIITSIKEKIERENINSK